MDLYADHQQAVLDEYFKVKVFFPGIDKPSPDLRGIVEGVKIVPGYISPLTAPTGIKVEITTTPR